MRNFSKYFGCTDTYGTDIQSTIMKEATKIVVIPVKVNTGDAEIDKMLLGKELSGWVQRTSKLSENMGRVYNLIIGKCMTLTR